jgi:multiple sugar transport system substrate-binding protein
MEDQSRITRRRFLGLCAMGATGAVLAACGPQPTPTSAPVEPTQAPAQEPTSAPVEPTAVPQEPVQLTFWHHFTGEPGDVMAGIIDTWNKDHPEVQVRIDVVPFDASAAYSEKMTAAAAAGAPPDVFLDPSGAWAVGLDLAIVLDPYMDRDGITLDDYYPGAVERVMWEGQTYGIPFNMDTRGLWWNKQLFTDAGLDPEVPPKTWDELYDYCTKINNKNDQGDLEVIGFLPRFDQAMYYSFIYQNGGRVQTFEKEHRPPTLLFDSQAGKEALAFMKKLVDLNGGFENQEAFVSSFTGAANDPFYMGQLAMMISGPWRLPDIRKYVPDMEWGLAPEPIGPSADGPCTLVGGFEVSIPKLSKSYDGAWEIVKLLGTLDTQIPMSKAAGNTPGHRVPDGHPYLAEDEAAAFFVKAGEWGASFPEAPWSFPLFFAVGQDAVDEVFTNAKTVDQALADARVKVQAEIDRWFENNP